MVGSVVTQEDSHLWEAKHFDKMPASGQHGVLKGLQLVGSVADWKEWVERWSRKSG